MLGAVEGGLKGHSTALVGGSIAILHACAEGACNTANLYARRAALRRCAAGAER